MHTNNSRWKNCWLFGSSVLTNTSMLISLRLYILDFVVFSIVSFNAKLKKSAENAVYFKINC